MLPPLLVRPGGIETLLSPSFLCQVYFSLISNILKFDTLSCKYPGFSKKQTPSVCKHARTWLGKCPRKHGEGASKAGKIHQLTMQCGPPGRQDGEGWQACPYCCSVRKSPQSHLGALEPNLSYQSPSSPGNMPESVLLASSITGGEQSLVVPRLDTPCCWLLSTAQSPWPEHASPVTGDLWGWTPWAPPCEARLPAPQQPYHPGPVQTL